MGQVNTIAVIGAGIMGRGIAHVAALGGYRTILEDLLPNALRKAEDEIRVNLDKAVDLGKISAGAAEAARGRLEYAGSVEEAAREADLVIEAVPEEMESKIEIFTLLDKICRPGTILASNTRRLMEAAIWASAAIRPIRTETDPGALTTQGAAGVGSLPLRRGGSARLRTGSAIP